jgi:hypothetical protein
MMVNVTTDLCASGREPEREGQAEVEQYERPLKGERRNARPCSSYNWRCTLTPLQSALRQMVYLVIKELSTIAEDVIMVTSSIMKDMQPNLEVIYRPNAIRALARIIDVSAVPRSTFVLPGTLMLIDSLAGAIRPVG